MTDPLAELRADDAALLVAVDRTRNGVPDAARCARHRRAAALAGTVLGSELETVRISPLGPGWSADIDLHVGRWPDEQGLRAAGWLSLDDLLRRLGSPGRGRWAIVADGEVLACADVQLDSVPDAAAAVLQRCRRRGEVRAREVLELRALVRDGVPLPRRDPVVASAARAEAAMGGDVLGAYAFPRPSTRRHPTLPLPTGGVRRRLRHVLARRLRRRPRLVIALSGVDGAGKSTLAERVVTELERAGVSASCVWTRPGMNLQLLDTLARFAKGLAHRRAEPGVRAVARGEGTHLPSRRGALGWVWALAVTVAYLVDVRRQHRRVRGVAVYDRHAADAWVTLGFVYEGVDLRLQRWLVRHLLPTAAWTFYLDVSADVAVARKPGDSFGEHAVRRQLEGYAAWLADASVWRLDADRPVKSLAAQVLAVVTGS